MQHLYQMKKIPVVVGPWDGDAGGRREIWAEYIEPIANLIRQFDLQVIEPEYLPIKDLPGGKRGPHLHYGDAVYAVNPKQWKAFTDKVIEECRARLDRAQEVPLSLDAVAEIGAMAAGLPF